MPIKMEQIVSSETSAIRTQTPGNYPKRNNLHLEHGESLRTSVSQADGPRVDTPGLFYHGGVLRKMQVKTDTLEN